MGKIDIKDVMLYVEKYIGTFHQKRIESLKKLKLRKVLKKKNPYLFKTKYLMTAEQIVKGLTDAFISSNEETIFGDWLEGLALFVNSKVFNGRKSGISGIDLEFDKDEIRYIVSIKSGPNWGNSSQLTKMKKDFESAMKTLRTSNSKLQITAINGCCYGTDNKDKGIYLKYCGQKFWSFISGSETLYIDLIEPLGHKAKERNEEFVMSYSKMINQFTKEFINDFCEPDGTIDWNKLVKFNSSSN